MLTTTPPAGRPSLLLPSQDTHALQLGKSVIDQLPDELVFELLNGGSEADLQGIFDDIIAESRRLLDPSAVGVIPPQADALQLIPNLADSMHETCMRENLLYFIQTALPSFDLNWHTVEWAQMVQWHRQLCILAARDHGKSYFFSFAYPLWMLYRYRKSTSYLQQPLRYRLCEKGVLFTNSLDLGKGFLEEIKTAIEETEMLREVMLPRGRTAAGTWGAEKIRTANGANLMVKSYPTKRGLHPGWGVFDDLLDESMTYSQTARDKMWAFFTRVMIPMIVPHGQLIGVGTPLHQNDLYAQIRKKMKSFRYLEYPALFPDGTLLYEARHSYQAIMDKKRDLGIIAFTQELLVNAVSNDTTLFPRQTLEMATRGMEVYSLISNIQSAPMPFSRVVMGCDFAISGNVGSDDSVFVTLGVEMRGDVEHYWLLNIFRGNAIGYNDQQSIIKMLWQQFRHDLIGMEDNAMQDIFRQEAERAGLPVIGITTGVDKNSLLKGIPSLVVLFQQGRFHFPVGDEHSRNEVDWLFGQLGSMAYTNKGIQGVGSHDDGPSGLWKAVQTAQQQVFRWGSV